MTRSPNDARRRMVEEQLRGRGISDARVLAAFAAVPRHTFVLPRYERRAYDDCALPFAGGQTISQPYMVAVMTEAAAIEPGQRVLEIGTGSGYQAAILAYMGAVVYSVERIAVLAEGARERLAALCVSGVEIKTGDGSLGWPEHAPYARIIVTAGAPSLPAALLEQLAEGGRLIIPVGDRSMQTLTVVRRHGGQFLTHTLGGCVFVPLLGQEGWPLSGH
ncbi:MAG: protein-L-isoaspartate(D-aspartate) O-methyltransferase [Candidatus Omnitrophica bacterium]|nr:protein-L-isoaspartate(D-aspartate) O-methyltransferase [Candidatus Omnitrophota bacterium]